MLLTLAERAGDFVRTIAFVASIVLVSFAGCGDDSVEAPDAGSIGPDADLSAADAAPEPDAGPAICADCVSGSCSEACTSACAFDCPACDCSFDCTAATGLCQTRCQNNSNCDVDCAGGGSCETTCEGTASCDVDCTGATSCGVFCKDTSNCIVDCTGAASCAIGSCEAGGLTSCPGFILVCNRACP
jgi:hypothetical protein